jgi:hypothetical protein
MHTLWVLCWSPLLKSPQIISRSNTLLVLVCINNWFFAPLGLVYILGNSVDQTRAGRRIVFSEARQGAIDSTRGYTIVSAFEIKDIKQHTAEVAACSGLPHCCDVSPGIIALAVYAKSRSLFAAEGLKIWSIDVFLHCSQRWLRLPSSTCVLSSCGSGLCIILLIPHNTWYRLFWYEGPGQKYAE